MMNAQDLYRAGKLDEAIEALNGDVRKNPSDADARAFLADLLCLVGNFERADVQLDALAKILPGAMAAVALVRQLVRAEQWRQQCFLEGRLPELLGVPDERTKLHLKALALLRSGDAPAAAADLAHAEELRGSLRGNGQPGAFEDFRDADDLTSSFFEVLTSTGKYYWIPMERVARLELRPLERPRDLLWRRAAMQVSEGPEGEVYLPAIYAPAPKETAARLGRTTEWTESAPVRGIGARCFLVGEELRTLHELGSLGEITFGA
ncbi:MAG: tetratricopeptide repeat protein [Planctomycetes bacterium]|nr:tetratricopeptide repeat protein [Planctomycetota bacterium]